MRIRENKDNWMGRDEVILGKSESILELLDEKRLFGLHYNEFENRFVISEKCDGYFDYTPELNELKQLAELFDNAVKYMEAKENK